MKITNGGETSTLYRKESALTTTQRSFSKEGLNYYSFGRRRRRRRRQLHHYGRRKRAKIGESEGKSAREDGESRRWKHAECVPLSLSFFVCIIQNELDLLCALSARILTLSFFLSLSLSLSLRRRRRRQNRTKRRNRSSARCACNRSCRL